MNTTNNQATPTNSQPNAGALATHTAVTGAQEINATPPTPQFKFHFGTPSLVRKAATKITPEAAEAEFQKQIELEDKIQKQLELGAQLQGAEKAQNDIKVAELKEQRKFIPWPALVKTQDVPEDIIEKVINALKQDDPDLLKMAMEIKKIDPTTKKPVMNLATGTPVLKTLPLEGFIYFAKAAIDFNALKSLNFLLAYARNISLAELNNLLTHADSELASAEILQLLINRAMNDTQGHPRVEFFDTWNQFPLHKALVENRALEVAKLIDDGANVNDVAHDMTPLLLACKYGADETSYEITKMLIEKKASVNAQDRDGRTPLMYASRNGNTVVVQLLIAKEATIDAQDTRGWTPLMFASNSGHTAVAQLLIAKEAKVEAQDTNGRTSLMSASGNGHTALVQLLIKNGAQVNVKNNQGISALEFAIEGKHQDIVKLLIENRADVNAKNRNAQNPLLKDQTPLMLASKYGHTDIVQLLIDNGAKVNDQDVRGKTPLLFASKNGHTATVQLLIKNKAEVNVKNKEGDTPLLLATKYIQPAAVKILLNAGADDTITDVRGKTALQIAVESGYKEIVDILKPKFATITNTVDDESDSEGE